MSCIHRITGMYDLYEEKLTYVFSVYSCTLHMRNVTGWLETRLAQNNFKYLFEPLRLEFRRTLHTDVVPCFPEPCSPDNP